MSSEKNLRSVTRRQALAAAGLAGAGLAASGALGGPGLAGRQSVGLAGPEIADAATCIITPELSEGPLFVDENLNRSDVRESRDGVRLTLTINVFSADANCDPFSGATVDVWQCDAQGIYSDVPEDNAVGQPISTLGQTFLRGNQVSDSNGRVTFTTIFPGWYPIRAIHLHLKVRVIDGGSTVYDFNTQIYFEQSDIDDVLSSPAYQRSEPMTVTNDNDRFFDPAMILPLQGSVEGGLNGTIDVGLAGMPEEVVPIDSSVSAAVKKVRFSRLKGGRRTAVITLKSNEWTSADARIQRGGKLLSRMRNTKKGKGTRQIKLPVSKSTRAGKALLRIVLLDRVGNRKIIRRVIRIPSKKS
jgi:protocatechuate 3,4-dioxygenase beta subunit